MKQQQVDRNLVMQLGNKQCDTPTLETFDESASDKERKQSL
jgi:hypothetical protein